MTLYLVSASLIVMVAATIQGSVGFGLGMLAAPLLALINPDLVPGPLLAAALVFTVLMAYREREAIVFREIGWALVGRTAGTLVGAVIMIAASQRIVSILVGVVVFISVGLISSGITITRKKNTLIGAGLLSGFMSTTTSIGGPPVAVLYKDSQGTELRAAMSGFFLVGLLLSLTGLTLVGRFGVQEAYAAGWLIPGAVIGFLISGRVIPFIDRGHTKTAVLAISTLAGVSVIINALMVNGI